MDMTLKCVRGISYSQLYKEDADTIDDLLQDLPTCDSVRWLSFLIHQKITLTEEQTDYNIIIPLLFQFDSDLQHRIVEFMGPVGAASDQFLNLQALLEILEWLLTKRNNSNGELTKEDKSRLFKAYLINCDKYLDQQEVLYHRNSYSAEDMLKYYMPFELKQNKVLSVKNPLVELVKSKLFLIDFASCNKQFSKFVDGYIEDKKFQSVSHYMSSLFDLSSLLICNKRQTNLIKIGNGNKKSICDFLDNFCINVSNDNNCVNMQEKPLYKVDEKTYCVLYLKFFVDKFFHSLLFDIAKVCERKGMIDSRRVPAYIQIKQLVGQKFTEQYLFYNVIDKILADCKFIKRTGDEMDKMGQGLPDYYARKAKRIFIFEFKDIQLADKIVKSGDFDTIINAIEKAFVRSDKGRPKGISQLANDIVYHLKEMVGDGYDSQTLSVYPILVYTDSCFDIEGFNYYLNNRFREILYERDIRKDIVIKDLIMVNIDSLITFEKAFVDKKVKFDVLINEYISYKKSKEQYNVVPFNKFLFQRCKQKGYFFKASYLVREMIGEMVEREECQNVF